MSIKIDPRQILLNLLELKTLIAKRTERSRKEERIYFGLLNSVTGALLFSDEEQDLQEKAAHQKGEEREWTAVRLLVSSHRKRGNHFQLLGIDDREVAENGLSEEARKIADLTVAFLNQKSLTLSKVRKPIEEAVLEDLGSISIRVFPEEIESHPAWAGLITRCEAENLLKHAPKGSYLLRYGDELTEYLRINFSTEEARHLEFFIITCSEGHGKMSEKTIIKDGGWFIYNDEPNLRFYENRKFSTLVELLHSLHALIQEPFRRKNTTPKEPS